MWNETSYRRHLCDMHIEDWNSAFLSKFDIEKYYENLKTADVQSAMIYLQSHVGYCYYPTKVGKMHRAFAGKENDIKKLIQKCRNNNISVVGYYSVIYNTWAHDNFPEWKMVNKDGLSRRDMNLSHSNTAEFKSGRYGLCCPNNKQYREFIFAQIDEISKYCTLDGMFYDMLFWPHFCYCPSCRKRWKDEVGGDIPVCDDRNSPLWRLHLRKRREWMAEFANAITDYTKKVMHNVTVEHNMAHAVLPNWQACQSPELNQACDYVGGDLYGGISYQSFTCKFYRNLTRNQPFEYMFSRCEPDLAKHTTIKSDDMILSSVMLTCAHHGATLVIDAIDPVGTFDDRVYPKIRRAFDIEKPFEKYLHGDMIEDIGIYYSFNSRFENNGNEYKNTLCAINAAQTLSERHIPYGVCGVFCDINRYNLLIAPALTDEDSEDFKRITDYVKNGGNLIFSDGQCTGLIQKLLSAEISGYTKSKVTYISPCENNNLLGYFIKEHPMPFEGHLPLLSANFSGKVCGKITLPFTQPDEKRYASIHSNPPGIETDFPAIVEGSFGKGKFIWVAPCIEFAKQYEYRALLVSLIEKLAGNSFTIKSDASKKVEIVSFIDGNDIYLSAVLLNEDYFAEAVNDFTIAVKCCEKPKRILHLSNENPIAFEWEDGYAKFKTKNFDIFAMFKIEK